MLGSENFTFTLIFARFTSILILVNYTRTDAKLYLFIKEKNRYCIFGGKKPYDKRWLYSCSGIYT